MLRKKFTAVLFKVWSNYHYIFIGPNSSKNATLIILTTETVLFRGLGIKELRHAENVTKSYNLIYVIDYELNLLSNLQYI